MAWMDSNWQYRQKIRIKNDSGSALTDYQIKVKIDNWKHFFANAKSDGSDIRFTSGDGTTQLNYWIESFDSTNKRAIVWVKVPSIPTGESFIYLYYGNSAAADNSNGENTFEFFDDFNGTSLDTSKWTDNGGNATLTGGELVLNPPDGNVVSKNTWATGYSYRAKVRLSQNESTSNYCFFGWGNGNSIGASPFALWDSQNPYNTYTYVSGNESHDYWDFNWTDNHTYEISRPSSNRVKFFRDDYEYYDHTSQVPTTTRYVGFRAPSGSTLYADWIFVRKAVELEPIAELYLGWEQQGQEAIFNKVYWIEKEDDGTSSGKLWTKVKLSSTASTSFYVYYSGSTDQSSGESVFKEFIDFTRGYNTGNLEAQDGWHDRYNRDGISIKTSGTKQVAEGDSTTASNNPAYWRTFTSIREGDMVEWKYLTVSGGVTDNFYWGDDNTTGSTIFDIYTDMSAAQLKVTGAGTIGNITFGTYFWAGFWTDPSNSDVYFYLDRSEKISYSYSYTNRLKALFWQWPGYSSSAIDGKKMSYVIVREYDRSLSTTITYGTEETGSWTIAGETYTKRKQVTISSNLDKSQYVLALDHTQFSDNNIAIQYNEAGSTTNQITKDGNARIKASLQKTATGTARIEIQGSTAYDGTARIQITSSIDKTGSATIKVTGLQHSKDGKAWLKKIWRITKDGTAAVKVQGIQKTANGNARVTYRSQITKDGNAQLKLRRQHNKDGTAAVKIEGIQITKDGRARIEIQGSTAYDGNARLLITQSKSKTGNARIKKTIQLTKQGQARIKKTGTKSKDGTARITYRSTKTKTGTARIVFQMTITKTGTASIHIPGRIVKQGTARIRITTQITKQGNARVAKAGDYPDESKILVIE